MKYIDAEKLKAEIERHRLSNRYIDTEGYEAKLLEIIDSLQQEQPEVDLEKGIKSILSNVTPIASGKNKGKYIITSLGVRAIACHFYELGLNARKEE